MSEICQEKPWSTVLFEKFLPRFFVNINKTSPRISAVETVNTQLLSTCPTNGWECRRLALKAARKFASNSPKIQNFDTDSGFETDQSKKLTEKKNTSFKNNAQNYVPMPWSGEKCFSKHRRKIKAKFYFNKKHIPDLITAMQKYNKLWINFF